MGRKTKSLSSVKKRADRVFSELVRRSAINEFGWIFCVTCDTPNSLENMDAGHFVSRKFNATKYDKRNVHPQCRVCNRWEEGKKYEYGKFLVEKYGEGIIDELNQLAHSKKRFTIEELEEMIKGWKKELKELGELK